jgi:L-lactate dehydrogenase complex protein LldE
MTGERVTLFATCLGDLVLADAVEHAAVALRSLGLVVEPARGATCCGQPAYNSGFEREARRVARRTLRALTAGEGRIAVPSGSCAAMLRLHLSALFRGEREEAQARAVAARVIELSALLAEHADAIAARGLAWEGRVGYHDSCHMLRELRLREEPRRLLATVRGLELVPLASSERCCGFGGTFSVRYPELSVAMADAKLDDAALARVDALVSADPGCLLQLGGRAASEGAPLRTLHIATLLHEAGLR